MTASTKRLDSSVSVTYLGDLRVPIDINPEDLCLNGRQNSFSEVRTHLSESDLVVANLEGPIHGVGQPRFGRGALLDNSEHVVDLARTWGLTVFSLANNHIMDYGVEGLSRTIKILERNNIPYVGAGLNEEEANRPLVLDVRGVRLGFLAFTTEERHVGSICAHGSMPGCANLTNTALDRVRALTNDVDIICVIVHWGLEFHQYPTPEQVHLVHQLVAAGAKVIIGHHPHVIQGVADIGESVAAYSLGNFYFPPFEQTNQRISAQSSKEREFILLTIWISNLRVARWESFGGYRNLHETLKLYSIKGQSAFQSRMKMLSRYIVNSDYADFYKRYALQRRRQLIRQELWKSLFKIRLKDLTSLSRHDFIRLWKRITSIFFTRIK